MSLKTIAIETNADGEFTYERRLAGVIKAIAVELDELSTPDIAISDGVWDTAIVTFTGLTADGIVYPMVAAHDETGATITDVYVQAVIFGSLKIEVTGGGANKTGTIRLLFA